MKVTRRKLMGLAASGLVFGQPHERPVVSLDMDQKELDDAYHVSHRIHRPQLRRDGVTQLITYIENMPRGESILFPKADNSWIANGWHFHIKEYWLRRPLRDIMLTYGMPPSQVCAFQIAVEVFVAASLLGAWAIRNSAWAGQFSTLYWGCWIVVSVSFHGLAIAGFRSGDEGLGADISKLTWFGTAALSLRAATDLIIHGSEMRAAVPFGRAVAISLS